MTVGRDHVGNDGENVIADTVKFMITEKVCDGKTPGGVCFDDRVKGLEDRVVIAVGNHGRSAETNIA